MRGWNEGPKALGPNLQKVPAQASHLDLTLGCQPPAGCIAHSGCSSYMFKSLMPPLPGGGGQTDHQSLQAGGPSLPSKPLSPAWRPLEPSRPPCSSSFSPLL